MMGNSLQDQLRALGLAKNTAAPSRSKSGRAAPVDRQKQVQRRLGQKNEDTSSVRPPGEEEPSLKQAYLLRENQEKEQAEQARRNKLETDRKRRQLNQRIREIVEPNRLNDAEAEFSRNFMYKGRIRKVNVSAEQLKALNEGSLGLVYLAGGYHIMLPEHVEQVRRLSAEHVPDLGCDDTEEGEYPVPDDLIW